MASFQVSLHIRPPIRDPPLALLGPLAEFLGLLLTDARALSRSASRSALAFSRAAAARSSASFVRAASLLKSSDSSHVNLLGRCRQRVTDDRVSGRHPFLVIFGTSQSPRALAEHEMLGDDERQPGPRGSGARKGSASRLRPSVGPGSSRDRGRDRRRGTSGPAGAASAQPVGRPQGTARAALGVPSGRGGARLRTAGSGKTVLLRSWVDAAPSASGSLG